MGRKKILIKNCRKKIPKFSIILGFQGYYRNKRGNINCTSSYETVVIDLTLSSDEEEGTDFTHYNVDEM